jgi:hypothetical protein
VKTEVVQRAPRVFELVADRETTPLEDVQIVATLAQMVGRHAPDWTISITQTTPAPVRYQPAAAGDQAPIPAGTEAAGLTDDEDEPAYDPWCTCGMRASDPFHVVDHQFVMAADQSVVPS